MLRLSIGGTYKEVIVTDRAGFEVLRMMEIAHGRAASGAEYKVLKIAVGIFRLSFSNALCALSHACLSTIASWVFSKTTCFSIGF